MTIGIRPSPCWDTAARFRPRILAFKGRLTQVPEDPVRVHLGAPSCYRASISASKRRTCRRASGYLVRKSMMSAQPSPF